MAIMPLRFVTAVNSWGRWGWYLVWRRLGGWIRLFTPEVGLFWAINSAHRRSGYATEAAAGLAKFAFEELHVERVVAMTEHSNLASIGVMRGLGMRVERNPQAEPA
jgi:RimJ/RimL family protein N-acetyltransferase